METPSRSQPAPSSAALRAAILVAALGYFVDVYDIALFGIVRVASLRDLGVAGQAVLDEGIYLMNMQMGGMLLGGLLWGILGDKLGRVQVLFGSILLYSIANIANAAVGSVSAYAACRFAAGVGLAGEVGAGVTLVAEMMPKGRRGLGTTLVATVGVSGAVAAALVGDFLPWRTAYVIGGLGGLVLLALRVRVHESGLFSALKRRPDLSRGDFLLLLRGGRAWRYLSCVFVGIPMFFFIAIIGNLAPEVGRALGIAEPLVVGHAILGYSVGMTIGDLASGLLSQWLRSRKGALAGFIACAAAAVFLILTGYGQSALRYYVLCLVSGIFIGYWAVLITAAAEQFGTNVRATVASTVPNFARGSTLGITLLFEALKPALGVAGAVQCVALVCFGLAALGVASIRETFGQDLDFLEGGRELAAGEGRAPAQAHAGSALT